MSPDCDQPAARSSAATFARGVHGDALRLADEVFQRFVEAPMPALNCVGDQPEGRGETGVPTRGLRVQQKR